MSETFQNSSAIASEVECDGVAVEVPPRWYAWAESNKGIKSIKISKTLGREVKTGVIVFLRARVWNENSLEEAKKKYLSNGTHKEVSVEKWKKRTWLLIKDIEGSYLKWTARTITGPHMFKWSVANGPQASQDILLSILKSVSFK